MGLPARVAVVSGDARLSRLVASVARHAAYRVRIVGVRAAEATARLSGCDIAIVAGGDGTGLTALHRAAPSLPVIAVVPAPDQRAVAALLRQGVVGVVAEARLQATLPQTIAAVACGQLCVPGTFASVAERPRLSIREKQILGMIVLGFANVEIAQRLVLAESTVKSHLNSAFRKLGVRTRVEAAELILDPTSGLGTGILTIPTTDRDRSAA